MWFVAGAGAGVYAMVRGRRAAEVFTADGLRDRAGALLLGARLFRDEVAQGSVVKESELRERYGLSGPTTPELGTGRHRATGPAAPATRQISNDTTPDEEGTP